MNDKLSKEDKRNKCLERHKLLKNDWRRNRKHM